MKLLIEGFNFTGKPEDGGLQLSFKRYRNAASDVQHSSDGISLLLLHCVGTHKETWEPTIERIFELQSNSRSGVPVLEAWSMDSPNHGHAAALNDAALLKCPQGITGYTWGNGLQQLISSGLIGGTKIVGIGHSAGAAVMVLSTIGYPLDRFPFSSLILVEPGMATRPILDKMLKEPGRVHQITESAKSRKDTWPSREAAYDWFAKRHPWKRWDKRILQLFVDNGLRDMPTGTYPDKTEGVTLACTRAQEAAGYVYHEDGIDSLNRLSELCPVIPVHCILGSRIDIVSEETHQGILNPTEGRNMATITRVRDVGHLVIQENPVGAADAIWSALNSEAHKQASRL